MVLRMHGGLSNQLFQILCSRPCAATAPGVSSSPQSGSTATRRTSGTGSPRASESTPWLWRTVLRCRSARRNRSSTFSAGTGLCCLTSRRFMERRSQISGSAARKVSLQSFMPYQVVGEAPPDTSTNARVAHLDGIAPSRAPSASRATRCDCLPFTLPRAADVPVVTG